MKKLAILIFLSLYSNAFDLSELRSRGYDIEQISHGETLESIAQQNYKKSNYQYKTSTDFKQMILEWNPHLKNHSDITGQFIYLRNPYSPNISYKWAPDLSIPRDKAIALINYDQVDRFLGSTNQEESSAREPASGASESNLNIENLKSNWISFIHATISQGQFNENFSGNKIVSEQNSPFTIGLGLGYAFDNLSSYSLSSSIYYSKLQASAINDRTQRVSNSNISLPAEIGVNLYLQKNLKYSYLSNIYGGVDYENFNTFNFESILNSTATTLAVEKQALTYLTAGLGFSFQFLLPTSIKTSFSQGINSKTDLSGSKVMLYFNQKLTKRFWYHLLYKQHTLSSSTRELTISRYGIGVGMAF